MIQHKVKPATIGPGIITELPGMDFETYSEAGYLWHERTQKWTGLASAPKNKRGLPAVGAAVYAEHPTTEIVSLAYSLPQLHIPPNAYHTVGKQWLVSEPRLWVPGMPPPHDLFDYLKEGNLMSAWNSPFEFYVWLYVAQYRMGWPALPYEQLRDAMAKSRRCALPGALEKSGKVLNAAEQKDKAGDALMKKFSMPRKPTKKNPNKRIFPTDEPLEFEKYNEYNRQDVRAESCIAGMLPDLTESETELWLLDQKINYRGAYIDKKALGDCLALADRLRDVYTTELCCITGCEVSTVGELAKIQNFLHGHGVHLDTLDAEIVEETLKRDDLPPVARRVLEIRASLGAASIKKLYAIERQLSHDSRLRGLFMYCGADRTGRWAGQGPQPQNLKAGGPDVRCCDNYVGDAPCGALYWTGLDACPSCYSGHAFSVAAEWGIKAVETALKDIATRDMAHVEKQWGDAIDVVCGCLRGLFVAAPGADLICSDFSAIEAVVLAVVAGEQWRIDIFNTHGRIYEQTAADITGIPFDEIVQYKKDKGMSHPMRKPMGKIPELASGYQGGIGAWLQFGAGDYMTDDEIKMNVKRWRAKSPNIVTFWYRIEETAIRAVQNPGECFYHRGVGYAVKIDHTTGRRILFCRLPSGRLLYYWDPELRPDTTPWGKPVFKLSYNGWNTDYKKGPTGWLRLETYGGKLTENIVQAIARDLLAFAMINVEKAGYPIVLHVHDEIVVEVKKGTGSVEEFERIMQILPPWAQGWPIKAAGGWRGFRYRKD